MNNFSQEETEPSIWFFGYGSLLWKPQIQFHSQSAGYIRGFKRTFNLANMNVRGQPDQPGRVAIIEEDEDAVTWGNAYEVRGHDNIAIAFEQLDAREIKGGGYLRFETTFYPRSHHKSSGADINSASCDQANIWEVIVYTATPDNPLYLGDCDLNQMAAQVLLAKGTSGTNAEYVLKTAHYVRDHIPEGSGDTLLFGLAAKLEQCIAAGLFLVEKTWLPVSGGNGVMTHELAVLRV